MAKKTLKTLLWNRKIGQISYKNLKNFVQKFEKFYKKIWKISYKNFVLKFASKISYKNFVQKFRTKMSYKNVVQKCRTKVSYKNFVQKIRTKVSYKSFLQKLRTTICNCSHENLSAKKFKNHFRKTDKKYQKTKLIYFQQHISKITGFIFKIFRYNFKWKFSILHTWH